MLEPAHASLRAGQTLALIESSPLDPISWEKLAEKVRGQNDPLSIKSLEIIIKGLRQVEDRNEQAGREKATLKLSGLSQSMFVRLAKAYNSPTLLKEVGLIYLRDLNLPEVALEHFERSLVLGGPEKELRPLTEAAAVAVQRQITQRNGQEAAHSGITTAQHAKPVATSIIRRTGKMLLPSRASQETTRLPNGQGETAFSEPLPATTEDCLAEVDAAIKKGKLKYAEALLKKANEKPGNSEEMWQRWTDLGQFAYEAGDFSLVESAFLEARNYDPKEMVSHFNVALGYHLNEKLELAISSYAKANEIEPNHPKVWCNLGVLYFQMDAYPQAEEALRFAVNTNRNYARAWDNLAAALGAQDKLEEAIEACLRAVELRPDYPEAYFKLGVIYFAHNQLSEAGANFRRAALMPQLTAYCDAFLAMIHARLEQPEAAEAAVVRASQADPKCDLLWMSWNDLGSAWYSEKNYERASNAYGEATVLKPDAAEAWFNLGVSLHQGGDVKAARDAYEHAVGLNETLVGAWHNLGIICAEMGELDPALGAFQKETEWSPGNVRAWYDLGVTLEKMGRTKEAKAAFGKADSLGNVKPHPPIPAGPVSPPELHIDAPTSAPAQSREEVTVILEADSP
jgi:tetratricopeptide (TPR) repeat protein